MLKLTILPSRDENFILACSGGVDSMAAAHFLKSGGRKFTLAYFNHGTPLAPQMESHVQKWGYDNNIPVVIGRLSKKIPKGSSLEDFWRIERYQWLESFNKKIITCHHLDDVVESWIFSSLNGEGKIIPFKRNNIIRPFLMCRKQELKDWCTSHNVLWIEDQSNSDVKFSRNRIRHNIIPECLKINPGLHTVLRKKIINQIHYEKN